MISETSFQWVDLYREISLRLFEFRENQEQLIAHLIKAGVKGLEEDQDKPGEQSKLRVIDPFTVFASFNKYSNTARRKILNHFCNSIGIEAEVPSDFSGTPRSNPSNFWYFPYQYERQDEHIQVLWELFTQCIEGGSTFPLELFEKALSLKGIGEAKLTSGLFCIAPEANLSLNKQTTNFLARHNIESNESGAQHYIDLKEKVQNAFPDKSFIEIAYLARKEHVDIENAARTPNPNTQGQTSRPNIKTTAEDVSAPEQEIDRSSQETPAATEQGSESFAEPTEIPTSSEEATIEPEPKVEPEPTTEPVPKVEIEPTTQQKLVSPESDQATKVDLLGRMPLVNVIKGIVDHKEYSHLVVGLFGRWGSGKSSVVQLLRQKYIDTQDQDKKDMHFMVFNAWQNEHSQNMGASIADLMVKELYEKLSLPDQLMLSFKQQLNLKKDDIQISGLIFLAFVIFAIIFAVTTQLIGMDYNKAGGAALSLTAVLAIARPIFRHVAANPFTSKLKALTKKPAFNQHIGIAQDIKQQIKNLLDAHAFSLRKCIANRFRNNKQSISKNRKYILVIDDLDRCSDAKIVQLLEAIQLIINLNNIIVILAVDNEMLMQAVATKYCDQRKDISRQQGLAIARDYLGKIIQISVELDMPSTFQRQVFINDRLYKHAETEPEDAAMPKNVVGEMREKAQHILDASPTNGRTTNDMLDFALDTQDFEDEDWEFEETEEYLQDDAAEAFYFSECVGAFDIFNPRTMIRIHNTVTLLKGLYPALNDDDTDLKVYIFLVFWLEWVASNNSYSRQEASLLLSTSEVKWTSPRTEIISQLAVQIGLHDLSEQQKGLRITRARKLSLPLFRENDTRVESA